MSFGNDSRARVPHRRACQGRTSLDVLVGSHFLRKLEGDVDRLAASLVACLQVSDSVHGSRDCVVVIANKGKARQR